MKKKKDKKWTVLLGKKEYQFDDRPEAVKFIADNPESVTGIKHYNVLTSAAIPIYKAALRLRKNL